MMHFVKKTLADVAGTEEPIYGPSALQSVAEQAKTTPYTELKRDDLKWLQRSGTNVETQTFYFTANSGHIGMAQIIYSNVAGIRKTAQFTSKIFYPDRKQPANWTSDQLDHYSFPDHGLNFKAKHVEVTLSPDGNSYTIKSTVNKDSQTDITVHRLAPGFVVGKNGTTHFGTDHAHPWGSMMHSFWPRCRVEGTITTKSGPVDFAGKGMYIHALQGMKPHHAAARWNFVDFQGPTYSAVMMEFTTPPSYGTSKVNVSCIATDDKIVFANASGSAAHTSVTADPENGWPEPTAFRFDWTDGKSSSALIEGSYGPRIDRIDVMAEVPAFVKSIVASAAGTKPYIYQFLPEPELVVNIDGKETKEKGILFTEATFISALK